MRYDPNQIEKLKNPYSHENMKIYLADGSNSDFGEKWRVSGIVYFPIVDQDLVYEISKTLVEPSN